MAYLQTAIADYIRQWIRLWDQFWFTPADPTLLALIRWCAGAIILYAHCVWSLELPTFFGQDAMLPAEYRAGLVDGTHYVWSHFDWLPSAAWLWPVHIAGLVVMFLFWIGAWTRVTSILTALLVISYANRTTGAQFGLDQINGFLAIYLAVGPSGARLSWDRWWACRHRKLAADPAHAASTSEGRAGQSLGNCDSTVTASIALRLIQVHMCVVYLFAGLGKLQGDTWWLGQALWGAFASAEYQTMDFTWLAHHMAVINILTYVTLIWEVCYAFLVWPKLTRPLFIAGAVLAHAGIGLTMGMLTFGMIMIVGNMAFLSPTWVRDRVNRCSPRW
jgi:hypothetical protein